MDEFLVTTLRRRWPALAEVVHHDRILASNVFSERSGSNGEATWRQGLEHHAKGPVGHGARQRGKPSIDRSSRHQKHSAPAQRAPSSTVAQGSSRPRGTSAKTTRKPRVLKRLEHTKAEMTQSKDLASSNNHTSGNGVVHNIDGIVRDRLVLMVRGPFWLHCCWELAPSSVQRAQVAMGQDWHTARPVLRLLHIGNPGTSSSSERVMRDIPVHGGVKNWYIDVREAPQTFRTEIGYLSARGRFYSLGSQQLGDHSTRHGGRLPRCSLGRYRQRMRQDLCDERGLFHRRKQLRVARVV